MALPGKCSRHDQVANHFSVLKCRLHCIDPETKMVAHMYGKTSPSCGQSCSSILLRKLPGP